MISHFGADTERDIDISDIPLRNTSEIVSSLIKVFVVYKLDSRHDKC
jgi:hypothetical protein